MLLYPVQELPSGSPCCATSVIPVHVLGLAVLTHREPFRSPCPLTLHSNLLPNLLYIRIGSKEKGAGDIPVVVLYSGQR